MTQCTSQRMHTKKLFSCLHYLKYLFLCIRVCKFILHTKWVFKQWGDTSQHLNCTEVKNLSECLSMNCSNCCLHQKWALSIVHKYWKGIISKSNAKLHISTGWRVPRNPGPVCFFNVNTFFSEQFLRPM